MLRAFLLSLLMLSVFAAVSAARPFVFTAIPDQDETRLQQRFNGVARYLEQRLDVEVKFVPVKSYAAAVTAFRNNQVQMAWFGGLSGVRARQAVPGSQAIVQGYEDQAFHTYFIAHASTGLERSEDFPDGIEGKTFTFGSKGSTSGRLMPEYYIRRHFDAAPEAVFSRVGFSGDHSKTISLVESGAYQVGAVNFKVWQKEREQGDIDTSSVRVIWETPAYPDYQFTVRGDVAGQFGDGFVARLTEALLGMDDPELLDAFPRSRFVPASNEDYRPILETGQAIGLLE